MQDSGQGYPGVGQDYRAEAPGEAWLLSESNTVTRLGLTCSIGRSNENTLVLPGDRVSRKHALIQQLGPNEYWLSDLGSSNGTWVNGSRISQPVRLHGNDMISIMPYQFTFRLPEDATEDTQMMTGERTQQSVQIFDGVFLVGDIIGHSQMSERMAPTELSCMITGWLAKCREITERNGGKINKFLGDGFFAVWRKTPGYEQRIASTLQALRTLQQDSAVPFRVAMHVGTAASGSTPGRVEENLVGADVNFVFRMEKIAAGWTIPFLVSTKAAELLKPHFTLVPAGSQSVQGFSGEHAFFTIS